MKTSVYIATSLDGFIARENGDLDWLPGADGETQADSETPDFGFNAFMDSVDVLVMGRKTFEKVMSFGEWPYDNTRVMVLSRSIKKIPDNQSGSVEIASGSPQEVYSRLAEENARHLYIDGGATIQGFLAAKLITEVIITIVPVLIGKGIPLFGPLNEDIKLKHTSTQSFENGFVQSSYEVLL